ncbi:metalloendopeptidase [Dipsacomyces acuminosporus]|nr:metalloendopeptidase [Dipsacomyces acuminosporus]
MSLQFTADSINARTDSIISNSQAVQATVAAQPQPTFANAIAPLAQLENELAFGRVFWCLQSVHPDKAIRDACAKATERLMEFKTESDMRKDIYTVVEGVYENKPEMDRLDAEDHRLVERMESQFRRNGLDLDPSQRKELGELRKQTDDLSIKFSRNFNELDGKELFTREQLDGLPDSFFEGRDVEVADGVEKFAVTTKYPDLHPVLRLARDRETRKRLFLANDQRCQENVALLEQAIRLRLKAARLLGYSTHAEYVLEERMAKSPQAVIDFEAALLDKLNIVADKEIAEINELRRQLEPHSIAKQTNVLDAWDYQYYASLVKEHKYKFDTEQVREYFAADSVTRRILDFYEQLLHLRIAKVEGASTWHPSVDMYKVYDAHDDHGVSRFIGYFYLDLYPRQGKENHPCTLDMLPGFEKPDGTREYPCATLVANYSAMGEGKPALLTHDDVRVLLHELGHVFHHICIVSKWAVFRIGFMELDFLEAPSQMLENWVWQPEFIKKLASHYETSQPIPDALVSSVVAARNADTGVDGLRRLYCSRFDFAVHNAADVDSVNVSRIFTDLRRDIGRLDIGDIETAGAGVFGHMMQGYDAGFYVYMWSMVFSADMFAERFGKEGIDNRQTGLDYRHQILRPGATRDASASLEAFLGRKPNTDAFFKSLGL